METFFGFSLFEMNSLIGVSFLILEITLLLSVMLVVWILWTNTGKIFSKNKLEKWHNNFFSSLSFADLINIKLFIFTLLGSFMSLVYSEVYGISPCPLCWFQRVFMYSITIVLLVAILRKENKFISPYVLVLSALGFIIALYHHAMQIISMNGGDKLPCPAGAGDCSKLIIFEYGHITFPYIAVIMFGLVFVWSFFVYKNRG